MGRRRVEVESHGPNRITISLEAVLIRELKKQALASKNSLSGLVSSRLKSSVTAPVISSDQVTVVGRLKDGISFADLLKQLHVLGDSLEVVHVSGKLDLSEKNPTVTVVITK